MRKAGRRRPAGAVAWSVAGAVYAWIGALLLVPLGALVWVVAHHAGQVVSALTAPDALHAMALSLALAGVALVVNLIVGVMGAIVLTRQDFVGRRLLDAAVEVPLAVSPVMVGLGFFLIFGRNGLLRPLIDALDIKVAFAFPGLVIATLFVTLPFVVREVALVLEEVGTSEEQAAATLGATPWQAFVSVTLPNIRHGLELGATLTVARALGEFGAVLVLGGAISGQTQTATTFIHAAMEERQEAAAYGMALLLAAAAAGLLAILQSRKRS